MVILSLLIAILIDRSLRQRQRWQSRVVADAWSRSLQRYSAEGGLLDKIQRDPAGMALLWALPALLLALLLWLQESSLLLLVVNVVVLIAALGCAPQRLLVRDYLHKAHRNNDQGCEQLKQQLDAANPDAQARTIGQHLVWLNLRFYFAVSCWFIAFGAPGVVLYALLRDAAATEQKAPLVRILHWLEWVPVRLAGFSYLLVGHFNRALPLWLKGLVKPASANAAYLVAVADAAEDPQDHDDLTDEPTSMMGLAKRTMMLLLAATALATLLGWVA